MNLREVVEEMRERAEDIANYQREHPLWEDEFLRLWQAAEEHLREEGEK